MSFVLLMIISIEDHRGVKIYTHTNFRKPVLRHDKTRLALRVLVEGYRSATPRKCEITHHVLQKYKMTLETLCGQGGMTIQLPKHYPESQSTIDLLKHLQRTFQGKGRSICVWNLFPCCWTRVWAFIVCLCPVALQCDSKSRNREDSWSASWS